MSAYTLHGYMDNRNKRYREASLEGPIVLDNEMGPPDQKKMKLTLEKIGNSSTLLDTVTPTGERVATFPDKTIEVNKAEDLTGTTLAPSITSSSISSMGPMTETLDMNSNKIDNVSDIYLSQPGFSHIKTVSPSSGILFRDTVDNTFFEMHTTTGIKMHRDIDMKEKNLYNIGDIYCAPTTPSTIHTKSGQVLHIKNSVNANIMRFPDAGTETHFDRSLNLNTHQITNVGNLEVGNIEVGNVVIKNDNTINTSDHSDIIFKDPVSFERQFQVQDEFYVSASGIQAAGPDHLMIDHTSLGPNIVTSSLESVGPLNSGSITTGFGNINVGKTNSIQGGVIDVSDSRVIIAQDTVGATDGNGAWLQIGKQSDTNGGGQKPQIRMEGHNNAGDTIRWAIETGGTPGQSTSAVHTLRFKGYFNHPTDNEQEVLFTETGVDQATGNFYAIGGKRLMSEQGPVYPTRSVAFADPAGDKNVTATDNTILTDSTGGAFTLYLPSTIPAAGVRLLIKDNAGSAAGPNSVTIDGDGNTIDGNATTVLNTNYDSVLLHSDGTNWCIVK